MCFIGHSSLIPTSLNPTGLVVQGQTLARKMLLVQQVSGVPRRQTVWLQDGQDLLWALL